MNQNSTPMKYSKPDTIEELHEQIREHLPNLTLSFKKGPWVVSYDMAGDVDKYVKMTGYWYGDESDIPSVTDMFPTFGWTDESEIMADNTTTLFGLIESLQQSHKSPYPLFQQVRADDEIQIRMTDNVLRSNLNKTFTEVA